MAAERRDGPAGQGAVSAHQEAGHGTAGREGQERQRQRGALRNTHTTIIKAVQRFSNTGLLHYNGHYCTTHSSNIPILPVKFSLVVYCGACH